MVPKLFAIRRVSDKVRIWQIRETSNSAGALYELFRMLTPVGGYYDSPVKPELSNTGKDSRELSEQENRGCIMDKSDIL